MDAESDRLMVEVAAGAVRQAGGAAAWLASLPVEGVAVDPELEPVPLGDSGTVIVTVAVDGPDRRAELDACDDVVQVWSDTPIEPFEP